MPSSEPFLISDSGNIACSCGHHRPRLSLSFRLNTMRSSCKYMTGGYTYMRMPILNQILFFIKYLIIEISNAERKRWRERERYSYTGNRFQLDERARARLIHIFLFCFATFLHDVHELLSRLIFFLFALWFALLLLKALYDHSLYLFSK